MNCIPNKFFFIFSNDYYRKWNYSSKIKNIIFDLNAIYYTRPDFMAIKTIFLDRDGVINKEVGYLHKIEDFDIY